MRDKTLQIGNATAVVHQPELTETEYNKRLKEVHNAAAKVLQEKHKSERNNNEKLCV